MHKLFRLRASFGLRFSNSECLILRYGFKIHINSEVMSAQKRSAGTSADSCSAVKKSCESLVPRIGAEANLTSIESVKNRNGDMQIVEVNGIETLEAPDKSENDKKSYRIIRLCNGLKALLIYDPVTDAKTVVDFSKCNMTVDGAKNMSAMAMVSDDEESESGTSDDEEDDVVDEPREKLAACSLSVDVGSFSDPGDVQGLAHFLGGFALQPFAID